MKTAAFVQKRIFLDYNSVNIRAKFLFLAATKEKLSFLVFFSSSKVEPLCGLL